MEAEIIEIEKILFLEINLGTFRFLIYLRRLE